MIGRIVGGVLGGAIGQKNGNHPIAGTVIGAATLFAARRLIPQRYAVLAATMAAGYLTKKWAERAQERRTAEEARAAAPSGAIDTKTAPLDGQTMGDALPPAIPPAGNGRSNALH